jgi:hypothetical protein
VIRAVNNRTGIPRSVPVGKSTTRCGLLADNQSMAGVASLFPFLSLNTRMLDRLDIAFCCKWPRQISQNKKILALEHMGLQLWFCMVEKESLISVSKWPNAI